jgi:hypothetical protein
LWRGRVGKPSTGIGDEGVAGGDAKGFSTRSGDDVMPGVTTGAGCRIVFCRERSALTKPRGPRVSGSRNGLFSSEVALQDWMNDDTEADFR